MRPTYVLEYKNVDKLGRFKSAEHVGAFASLDLLEIKKQEILATSPNVIFEVYTSEHFLFESQPD